MIETDAPYLTPHPNRGKRNEPLYTKIVVSKMSELSGLEEEILEEIITDNVNRLFFS
jgi:TatD DNase family protein